MSIWRMLDIDSTADIKAIKQAYARKLKLTRPDEKPAEFQELHSAYQQALQIAKRRINASIAPATVAILNAEDDFNRTGDLIDPVNTNADIESNVAIDSQIEIEGKLESESVELNLSSDEEKIRAQYIEEARRLLEKSQSIIDDENQRFLVKSWRFLENSPFMLDPEFCWYIGVQIFKQFEYHVDNYEGVYIDNGQKWPALGYLDEIFEWQKNQIALINAIGRKTFISLKRFIDDVDHRDTERAIASVRGSKSVKRSKERKTKRRSNNVYFASGDKRMGAFFADLILAGLGYYFVYTLLENIGAKFETATIQNTNISFIWGFLLLAGFSSVQNCRPLPGCLSLA